ncbi:phosphate/phosphite/phosphonate ABC transporter substrate-binding protein [Caldalkalibacillus salinus]|uniref:phosphate/phosphite/phosphonate ABC transporter substrate-binding protein n=1 Tax=Caldalkalibacillus salinus TaxID=2803787 RepID=UPI00192307DC|nr:phosphate/phosphite/phosphonate ABC transporter substrate-binding protein [Caldalkalibacillus salinus]
MKKFFFMLFVLSMMVVLTACGTDADSNDETGSDASGQEGDEEALMMGFVPSRDAEKIATEVEPLEERLSEVLGREVQAEVMTNYAGLIEAMRTGRVDIGFLAPFNYVQAEDRANVELILKSERHGSVTYRAQYNVRAELDHIQSVEDLVEEEGLVWAFSDYGSTSGYLYPAAQLMDLGIEDMQSHFELIQTSGHDAALVALMNGDADVATTFEDARTLLEEDYPDVMERINVIDHTADIPNDTISVREGLDPELVEEIKQAFLSFNEDEDMMQVMNEVYDWTGIVEAHPEDYDIVRETLEKLEELDS